MCDYSLHAVATRPAKVGRTDHHDIPRHVDPRLCIGERARSRGLHVAGNRARFRRERQIRQPLDLDAAIDFRVGKFGEIDPLSRSPSRRDRIPRRKPSAGDAARRGAARNRAATAWSSRSIATPVSSATELAVGDGGFLSTAFAMRARRRPIIRCGAFKLGRRLWSIRSPGSKSDSVTEPGRYMFTSDG